MSNFVYDIQLGFLAFPLVAILLALPYALYQYRRFGAVSIWKTFVVFTFILYCLCAVSLVVFPLPKDPSAVVEIAQTPQLQPFHVIEQIRETTDFSFADRSTWGPTLRAQAVYEAIFNVMLTMPLGAYLCYLFRCRWWMALLIGFATTLMFETSQLTGLFGIYDHPYRLFDVDDLILNTTGTMLGFWLMIPISWALPSMNEVNEQAREKGAARVTFPRRLLATIVDLAILIALFALAWIMLSPTDAQIAKALAIDPSRAGAKTLAFRFVGGLLADPMSAILIALGIGAVLFAIIPQISHGRTFGKAIVGIRIVATNGSNAPAWSYWVRYLASALFLIIPLSLVVFSPGKIEGTNSTMPVQIIGLVVVVWLLTVIARVIGSFSGQPYVSLSEVVSRTRLVPSKQAPLRKSDKEENSHASSQKTSSESSPQNNEAPFDRSTQAIDDHGKQAALDSLLSVNYDEQHPLIGEQPTRTIGAPLSSSNPAEAPTRQIGLPQANPTQRITSPEDKRKIRRDQRPDAGGTQVFTKH